MERKYYMIRISQNVWEYTQKGVVAVGWSDVDLSKLSAEDAAEAVGKLKDYENTAPQVVGKKKNEVWRFKQILRNDIIVVPYGSNFLLAESEEEYSYNVEDVSHNLANQLKVKYQNVAGELRIVPRTELSSGFSSRLRVRGSTVTDLSEFASEIEKIFNESNYSVSRMMADRNTELENSFKQKLISDIQNGKTYLKSGGVGLEELVKLLFEIEGYDAQITNKQTFEGSADADVMATKSDPFIDTKILAQVKHHSGLTDSWGIHQLVTIREGTKYTGFKMVLITSGSVNDTVRYEAEEKDISIMDGDDLADWIYTHLHHIDSDIRTRLGISEVPRFLDET